MGLTWRQFGLVVLLLAIFAAWSAGLGWIFGVEWIPMFLSFVAGGALAYVMHYRQGSRWMARQLGAQPIQSAALDRLYRESGLSRKPSLYVTEPMTGANAFTISYAGEDAIFVTPEIYRARDHLKEPILAHELAHIHHNDSLLIGFVSAFEQMIGNLGRLWMLLLVSGLIGWVLLLFFWPFLLLVQVWSLITLIVYQPLAARLLREREFLADRTAARWTSTDRVKEALTKLEHYNRRWLPDLLNHQPGPLSTHPPLEDRLRRLEEKRSEDENRREFRRRENGGGGGI